METDKFEQLKNVDWADLYPRLVLFTERLAFWRYPQFRASPGSDHLSLGNMCEDIAQTVIEKVIRGERSWDPALGPLLGRLQDHVRSELSNLATLKSSTQEQLLVNDDSFEDAFSEDGYQPNEEQTRIQWRIIREAIEDDLDLQLLIEAVEEALENNQELTRDNFALILGVAPQEVTNLRRRLERKVRKLSDEKFKSLQD